MGSLSSLISDAFTIYSSAYAKIAEIGVEVVDLEGSPRQPRKINQLVESTNLYYTISPSIQLNDDGDEIIGVNGDVATVNNLLLKLKRAVGLYKLPAFPTPLTSFNFDFSDGGINVGPGQLGDLITNNGSDWTILNMGAPGTVPVATVNGIQWQSVVGNGIPSGGTTNQYLRKNSNSSYDVVWDTLTVSKITDITASAAELNILDGVTGVDAAKINFLQNVNADIQGQFTGKLSTTLTNGNFLVGNGSNAATSVTPTGDVTFNNLGVFAITAGAIVNADIHASAAIARTKIAIGNNYRLVINGATGVMDEAAALTASRVLVSDANGIPTESGVSTTTIGFMDATSSVQTQLDDRLTVSLTSPAQGAMLYYNGTNWVNFAVGTNGQLLSSNGTIPVWVTDPPTGLPSGGTTSQYLRKINNTDYNAEWHTLVMADITDVSTTSTELNFLSGLTVDSALINLLTGADGNIQDQIDNTLGKALTTDRILVGVGDIATAVTNLPTGITIGGAYIYRVGGNDVSLADGGTGASLVDPGADRIMFWDESSNVVTWLEVGTNLSITGTTLNATVTGTISGLTAGRIPYATSATTIADDSALTWDDTNNALTVGTGVGASRIHSTGTDNFFAGVNAGNFTLTGTVNVGIGNAALDALTNGGANTGLGSSALTSLTSGSSNTSVGSGALSALITGSNNNAFGRNALSLVTGNSNIGIGNQAGDNITSGAQNVIIGNDVDAQSATASGQLSIQNIIFGTGNTATGTSASAGNIGIAVVSPSARLHLPAGAATAGTSPLKLTTGTAMTTPEDGSIEYHTSHLYFTIGSTRHQLDQQISGLTTTGITYATSATTLGTDGDLTWDATNNALTVRAQRLFSPSGSTSLYLGESAGNLTTTSGGNVGLGNLSLNSIGAGIENVAVGRQALTSTVSSIGSTAIGNGALASSTGNYNTGVGSTAGANITSGTQNLILGALINAQSTTATGQLSIQNIIFGVSNSATGTTISTGSIGIGVTSPTRKFEVAGSVAIQAGTSTGQIARVGGVINTNTTTTGNVGTGEDTLFSYSVPANTLSTDKDTIYVTVSGTFAANVNNKTLRIRFGSSLIFTAPAFAESAGADWTLRFEIIRTGAATQKCHITYISDAVAYADYSTAAETLSGAVTLSVTGEATSNNDVVGEMFKVRWEPSE
jgi:hypothetical protein